MKPRHIPSRPSRHQDAYLRTSCPRKILAVAFSGEQPNDLTGVRPVATNPNKPAAGETLRSGVTFYDISDPANPKVLSEWVNAGGLTHGMEMDDSNVYVCGTSEQSKKEIQVEELHIINYDTPRKPEVIARFHIQGQHAGEEFTEKNRKNPNGTRPDDHLSRECKRTGIASTSPIAMKVWSSSTSAIRRSRCGSTVATTIRRLSMATRACRAKAAAPAPTQSCPRTISRTLPTIAVLTDEHFSCPPGFGRLLDITYLENITLLSTYHIAASTINTITTKEIHLPGRLAGIRAHGGVRSSRKAGNLFYQAWYNQGLARDRHHQSLPSTRGRLLHLAEFRVDVPGQKGRHTREPYPDWDSDMIYVTDGNGGGLTALRYTGPLPTKPPIPGVR